KRLVERRRRRKSAAADVVDHLRIDVLGRAEDAQAQATVRRLADGTADTGLTALGALVGHGVCYFFLPSLRKILSSAYFTPFPFDGSGPRKARISAATWPTFCLLVPLTTISVGFGVTIAIPSGIG